MTEQLASPTLALLYLAQGHRSRARATLREVLEAEPTNGYALALHARMQSRPQAKLHARFVASSATGIDLGAGELELEWTIPAALIAELVFSDHRVDVVVAFATRDRASLRFTSIPCSEHAAVRRLPAPLGPASAAVALVASTAGGPIRLLAVAEPQSW
jgi:hypothetical protein